jgi:ABC-type multidrug transport system ATPase subunit
MGTPAIAADNLRKSYGEVVALDGISFSVPFGSRRCAP